MTAVAVGLLATAAILIIVFRARKPYVEAEAATP
jgi:hypothetical protein